MKEILCFGDSNTYGLIPGTKERYGWETRWTGIVGEYAAEKGYRLTEEGLCGRTTIFEDPFRSGRNASRELPVVLESHTPIDRVILMLGTNDCKSYYGTNAGVIGLGIHKLIRQIKVGAPDAKILLISPIHLGEDIWNGYDPEFDAQSVETSKQLEEIYRQIAKEEEIDFLAASDYAVPADADREHLNEAGHKQLALAIIRQLEESGISA